MNRFALTITRITIVGVLCLSHPFAALADEPKEDGLHIEAQPLSTALREFSEQTGLQVGYASELAEGKSTEGVEGIDDPDLALESLLAASGLKHTFVNDQTVVIRAVGAEIPEDEGGDSELGNRAAAGAMPIVMAQNQTATQQSQASQPNERESEREKRPIEEIVVTGTLIRGAAPVGAPLISIGRDAIDKSGFSTAGEVIQSLPQTLGAGPNPDTTSVPSIRDAALNRGFGTSVNLRGLGADSTLTLVNGRRVAPGGADGSFVDVSSIPLSAIERIEVLPDGASALYGSDAIGGVVNIILRDDYEGAETRIRLGTVTNGSQPEYQAGQVLGSTWETGNALFAYEYLNQDPLFSFERRFTADSDLTPLGGDNFSTSFSNPGNIITGGQFAIPSGQAGTSLSPSDLLAGEVNLENERLGTSALPGHERHSAFAVLSQEIADNVTLFADALYTHRRFEGYSNATVQTLTVPSSNAFFVDPVGDSPSVRVQYSFIDDLGPLKSTGDVTSVNLHAGGTLKFFSDWEAEVYGGYSREKTNRLLDGFVNVSALNAALADSDPTTAFNPFGDGSNTNLATLETIREFSSTDVSSELWSINVKGDGSLFHVPAGDVKLALGLHYRDESLASIGFRFTPVTQPIPSPESNFGRDIFAAFGELRIPIIGEANAVPYLSRFDVSLAGRFEEYSDFGSTTNPKVGVSIEPIEEIVLRGTYSTSFRAPLLTELDTSGNQHVAFTFTDPGIPAGVSNQLVLIGGNADLGPEKATTWSGGIDLRPGVIPGFELGLTYFDTEITGRITGPGTASGTVLLANEDRFGSFITRNPDPALAAALLSDPTVQVLNFLPPGATVDVIQDFRVNNSAISKIRGLDATMRYRFDTGLGEFALASNSTYFSEFEEAITPAAEFVSTLDALGGQPNFRVRNSVGWIKDGINANMFINYTDGYANDLVDPEESIGSWTTVDFTLRFEATENASESIFYGTVFSINVQNLLDEDPPFVNNPNQIGYDPVNANPRGRFVALQILKRW